MAEGARPPDPPPTLADAWVSVDLTDLKDLNAESRSAPPGPESAAAMASAQQSAAMNPGYDPVTGLVGAIIGIQLAQSLQRSAGQTRANEPIALLRQQYEERRATLRLEEQLMEALRRQEPSFGTCAGGSGDRRQCRSELRLRPRVTVACAYRCIDVGLKVRWLGSRGKELYRNELVFQSDPMPADEAEGDVWARDDMAALRLALARATETLAGMLVADLVSGRVNLAAADSETLRYRNAIGVFHERGQVVREDPGRWLIRSIGGSLTSMPADRRLTTAEYYDYLNGTTDPSGQAAMPVASSGPDSAVAPVAGTATASSTVPATDALVEGVPPGPAGGEPAPAVPAGPAPAP